MNDNREPGLALLLRTLTNTIEKHEPTHPRWLASCPCPNHGGDERPSLVIDYKVPGKWEYDPPTVLVFCRVCRANLPPVCRALGLEEKHVLRWNDGFNVDVLGKPLPPARLPFRATLEAQCKRLLVMPERLAYLKEHRGLNEDTIRRYGIGWDFRRYTVPIYDSGALVNVRRYLPGGDPKWVGLAGRSVKYLYPDFPTTTTVLLVEGELDALICRQHGLPAVTCIGGVNTWDPDWNPAFVGRRVVIIYDCDTAGRSAAIARSRELCAAGAVVKVVDLALGDKEDVSDHFVRYGRTAEDLLALVRRTPEWKP